MHTNVHSSPSYRSPHTHPAGCHGGRIAENDKCGRGIISLAPAATEEAEAREVGSSAVSGGYRDQQSCLNSGSATPCTTSTLNSGVHQVIPKEGTKTEDRYCPHPQPPGAQIICPTILALPSSSPGLSALAHLLQPSLHVDARCWAQCQQGNSGEDRPCREAAQTRRSWALEPSRRGFSF